MIHQLLITLTSDQEINMPQPNHVHGWIYRLLPPDLSVHDERTSPFSINRMHVSGPQAHLTLSFFDVKLMNAFLTHLHQFQTVHWDKQLLRFSQLRFLDGFFGFTQWATPETKFWVRFDTPTAFRYGDNQSQPIPIPSAMYKSAYRKCIAAIPEIERIYTVSHMRSLQKQVIIPHVKQISITRKHVNSNYWMEGFTGEMIVECVSDDPHIQSLFSILTHFMVHSGVGAKTAYGFGQVTVTRIKPEGNAAAKGEINHALSH